MKTQLILAAALSVLAFNSFAADGYDRTHSSSFAEDGYSRTGSAKVLIVNINTLSFCLNHV